MSSTSMAAAVVTVRLALSADSDAVADIYNQGIAERTATFETEHGRLDGRWLDVLIVERLIPENQP